LSCQYVRDTKPKGQGIKAETKMDLLLPVLLNGVVSGLIYALLAAGFNLLFGAAGILFFAHGEIYMLGAIVAYWLTMGAGIPYPLVLILVLLGAGLFGAIIERSLFRPLRGRDFATFISSLALATIISNSALLTFGERPKAIVSPFTGRIVLFGAVLTIDRAVLIVVSMAVITALYLFLQRTRAGRAIRAVSQDAGAAALMGISINHTNMQTFFVALATCAAGGVLIAPLYAVDAFMGTPVLMVTLIVVVLGGLGSFPGAIIGGLLLGLINSFGYTFIGGVTSLFSFVVVIIVIIFRPRGLYGRA
jgi:branched-chain amino acid transport system permease protein